MDASRVDPARTVRIALLLALFIQALVQAPARAAEVQIGSLDDLDFGRVPPTANALRTSAQFCVAVEPRGRYSMTARGDGPGGSFVLLERSDQSIAGLAYQVEVSDRGRRGGQSLRPAVPLGGLRALPPRGNGACRQPFGTITVVIPGQALRAARPGRYRGTLSLTVAPE